jgi:N-acetylneuraminic acid mutarotase
VNQKIFIFGGIGSTVSVQNECLQDIVVLDINSWSWTTPIVKGTLPEPRFVHRMAAFSTKLLLFGGRTSGLDKFNDVHWFDTETMTWAKEDNVAGSPPSSRGGCSLVAIGTQVSSRTQRGTAP